MESETKKIVPALATEAAKSVLVAAMAEHRSAQKALTAIKEQIDVLDFAEAKKLFDARDEASQREIDAHNAVCKAQEAYEAAARRAPKRTLVG